MGKWFKEQLAAQPQHELRVKAELTERIRAGREKIDELMAAKRGLALAASNGDEKAKMKLVELDREVAAHQCGVETAALAIEAIEQQEAEDLRRQREISLAKGEVRLKAILDLREAEQRENIEALIDRFERIGDRMQADIWRVELSKLRSKLEAGHA